MTKRILIIDDDSFIRDVIQVTLSRAAGWSTIAAASGVEALILVRNEKIDGILLDISMPGMDGFKVFEQLQANPLTQPIPVILLTAKAMSPDATQLVQMGFAGFIIKPFNPSTLCTQISDLLGWQL